MTSVATARLLEPLDMPVYRLTVEQYRLMTETGFLTEEDQFELLDGVIVKKRGRISRTSSE